MGQCTGVERSSLRPFTSDWCTGRPFPVHSEEKGRYTHDPRDVPESVVPELQLLYLDGFGTASRVRTSPGSYSTQSSSSVTLPENHTGPSVCEVRVGGLVTVRALGNPTSVPLTPRDS